MRKRRRRGVCGLYDCAMRGGASVTCARAVFVRVCCCCANAVSSPNCVVMRREVFWETGGYDEDFSGAWGWVDIAWRNCAAYAVKVEWRELHRHRIGERDGGRMVHVRQPLTCLL